MGGAGSGRKSIPVPVGRKFGRWVVILATRERPWFYLCRCTECGATREIRRDALLMNPSRVTEYTRELRRKARLMRSNGKKLREIGEELGVTHGRASQLLKPLVVKCAGCEPRKPLHDAELMGDAT